jgi:hypothetical protein
MPDTQAYHAFADGFLKEAQAQGLTLADLKAQLEGLVKSANVGAFLNPSQTLENLSDTAKNVVDTVWPVAKWAGPAIAGTSFVAGAAVPHLMDISEEEAQQEAKTQDLLASYARQTELARHNALAGRYAKQKKKLLSGGRRL